MALAHGYKKSKSFLLMLLLPPHPFFSSELIHCAKELPISPANADGLVMVYLRDRGGHVFPSPGCVGEVA